MRKNMTTFEGIGSGATVCMVSDRHAATIIDMTETRITIQWDRVTVVKGSVQDGSAEYEYAWNPGGIIEKYSLRKNGRWVLVGDSSNTGQRLLPNRSEYHDPHF
jgi:hypothetical protein